MAKNLNTQVWSLDGNGYTQIVRDLFTSTPPVYTHADHIDNSFNFCVNGVNEQKKRAVLHMTDRANVTYATENIDNTFIGNWIYDNRGNYTDRINRVLGNGVGGVSNFAIAPNSGSQPSGGNFKILCNFNYLTAVWAPRIGFAPKTALNSFTYYQLKELDNESTAEDAEEGETWWAYYTRKSSDYCVLIDGYNEQVYQTAGGFSSTSIYEGQTRAGIPGVARVSWLKQPYYYGYSYGTDGCLIYNDNGQGRYADLTFDVIFSYSLEYMEKKDEYDDIWRDSYNNPYDRHNIIYGLKISKDIIMHIICSYGLPFSFSNVTNISIGNADYALPEVKNNTTTGNWFRGADAITADTDNNRWANTKDIDNKPAGGGGGGGDDDDYADMGIGVGTGVGGYTTFAIMTMSDLVDLLADFNANLQTGMSVVNNFICLYKLGPLSSYLCSTRVGNIIMSANASTNFVSARADYNIVTSQKNVITLGSYNVPRMTNTFYDFAPYSTYELFIPCCGWVPLPDTVAGRQIVVYLIIDLASCTCKGVCRIDGTTVAEASGVLGVSVPFFATDSGIKRAADLMAVTQMISGIAQGAVGAGAGAGALVVSGSANALQGLEQLYINGNTNYTAIKGGNGDITAVGNGEYCTVKITHPKVDEVVNNSRFGHSVGYLCNTVGKIKEFKGLTVCANPHVNGIDCTDSEKEEIKRLLEDGIIVN